jgi:hypothetical protein
MASILAKLLSAADAEWQYWGKSTWKVGEASPSIAHTDDDPIFAERVIEAYCPLVGDKPSETAIQNDEYVWSAVGMCYLMHAASLSRTEFPFSNKHSRFIRHFVHARKSKDTSAPYWGYWICDPRCPAISVGDIVGYARGEGMTRAKARSLLHGESAYEGHTDIVVAKRDDEIDVIGANVMDSVTKKTLKLKPNGRIADPSHCWFVLLKARFQ